MLTTPICLAGILLFASSARAIPDGPMDGQWQAWLDSPGGKLRFGLEIRTHDGSPEAWIINGRERLPVPVVSIAGETIVLDFVHYDSVIRATAVDFTSDSAGRAASGDAASGGTAALSGHWKKRSGPDSWTTMSFLAVRQDSSPSDKRDGSRGDRAVAGRWSVDFSSSDDPAVGIFEVDKTGAAAGTFLTTLGDYRYLGGAFDGETLELSCFDGAHAFLFRADLQPDGSLRGDFWSRDAWHETWTAARDDQASLPDAWNLTTWNQDATIDGFRFREIGGERVDLNDPRFSAKARIIEVFGTWCPNCNDATRYLIELRNQYGERGLSVTGLAFELTGDERRDAAQVERYIDHHGINYPVLLAGISDKDEATKAFPVLDRVRSYPTFIFLDDQNAIRGIYTGFSGPATGAEHEKLRESFERLIEQLLAE